MASKTTYELQVKLGATTSSSFKTSLRNAENALSGLNETSNKIMAGIAAGVTASAAAATYAISNAVETYTGFEQEMATVQAISGATASEFEEMEQAAMDAGRSTIYTAEESASALEYMSLAGWDVETSIAGLIPILHMAAATGKELGTTSDLVTDSMSALQIGVKGLDGYMDMLIQTNNRANTTAEELMGALIKTGGASKVLGADLDDTITALGILANNGLKGEEAGTSLNSILTRIASNSTALKELNRLNVSLFDDSGSFIGLEEALKSINAAMADFTDEQKAQSLADIAGVRRYSQMEYLLEAVRQNAETGVSAWDTLNGYVRDSSGALENMYDTTTDTLLNAQKKLESAKEDMQIRVIDVFSEDGKEMVSWLAEELPNATDSIVEFAEAHKGEFAQAIESTGEGIVLFWENGIVAGKWIITHRGAIVGAIGGITAGIMTLKAVTTGIHILELFTNPLSATASVAGLAITAIGGVAGALQDVNREAVNDDLARHFGDISLSLQEIRDAADYITDSESLTGVLEALKEFNELDGISEKIDDAVSKLNKLNWKSSVGMELSEEDQAEYQKETENYVKAAQEYATQSQYAVSISMAMAFDENDVKGQDIAGKINKFYEDTDLELAEMGTQLAEAVNTAFNDGLLDIHEEEVINKLQKQMAEIQQRIADGKFQAKLSLFEKEFAGGSVDADSFRNLQEELAAQSEENAQARMEAYVNEYGAAYNAHEAGAITDKEFGYAIDSAHSNLVNATAGEQVQSVEFQLNTITRQYADEIKEYEKAVQDALSDYGDNELWGEDPDAAWDYLLSAARKNGPSNASKQAVEELLETMSSMVDELYAYRSGDEWDSLSRETQNSIQNALDTIEFLQGMTARTGVLGGKSGDTDELQRYVVSEAEKSGNSNINDYVDRKYEELTGHVKAAAQQSVQKSMETAKTETIQPVVDETYAYSQEYLGQTFAQGFTVTAPVELELQPKTLSADEFAGLSSLIGRLAIYHNAAGGIYNEPILTTFAEDGPEAALPLDGSERAKSLWAQAGQMLGVLPDGARDYDLLNGMSGLSRTSASEKRIQVEYSPSIVIQGNAAEREVRGALSVSLDDLRQMLVEIDRENKRTAFG